jgi:D-alanine-D-alanine ligase
MKEESEERVLFSNGKNGVKKTKSLGPVVDLEEHVPPDWGKRIFNSVYLKTAGDIVDDQNITKQEVDYFTTILHLSPGDRILDLCCGQGRHSLELARRGFTRVKGLDRSHYLIQKAKAQARREGLNVQFKEGDARKLPYPN